MVAITGKACTHALTDIFVFPSRYDELVVGAPLYRGGINGAEQGRVFVYRNIEVNGKVGWEEQVGARPRHLSGS